MSDLDLAVLAVAGLVAAILACIYYSSRRLRALDEAEKAAAIAADERQRRAIEAHFGLPRASQPSDAIDPSEAVPRAPPSQPGWARARSTGRGGGGPDRDDDFEETPRWKLLMYPLGGAVGVLVIIGGWILFR